MRLVFSSAIGMVSLMLISSVVRGHHSHANYLEGEWLHLEGTVSEIHWMNPHSWVYLNVVDSEGQSRAWSIEGASVTQLRRDGWAEDSIQAGDTLKLRCHPLKDGSRGCLLGYITMDDGSEKEFD